jgi:hypothetical protein
MSITVKPYVTGGWEVDIRVLLPDGTVICARKKGASAKRVQCRMLGRSARAASVAARESEFNQGGGAAHTNTQRVRATVSAGLRESKSAEAKRCVVEGGRNSRALSCWAAKPGCAAGRSSRWSGSRELRQLSHTRRLVARG